MAQLVVTTGFVVLLGNISEVAGMCSVWRLFVLPWHLGDHRYVSLSDTLRNSHIVRAAVPVNV